MRANRSFKILFDDVRHAGLFAEIETIAGQAELDAARQALTALAAELGLSNSERRSYLEIVLSRPA
jgi:adenylate cyclase, class 2